MQGLVEVDFAVVILSTKTAYIDYAYNTTSKDFLPKPVVIKFFN